MVGQCPAFEMRSGMALCGLRRSLVGVAVRGALCDGLDAVLGEGARLAAGEVAAIAEGLRAVTTTLVWIVLCLVMPCARSRGCGA